MNDAAEKGYYEKKRRYTSSNFIQRHSKESEVFYVIAQSTPIKKISRSVQLSEDIYKRLILLENDNAQYTHASILNQLLNDALKKYGY